MPFSALALLDSLDVQSGDWIVQNTANGAVGRLVAQFAPARGIRVLGLVRRDAGVDELAALGIQNIVSTESDGWRERAAEILDGAEPRAAGDSVGGKAAGELLSLLGEGGTLVVFGAMDSPTMELSSGDIIFTQATVKGFWGSKVSADMDAATRGRLFRELGEHLSSGVLTLPVAATYGLDEADAAVTANGDARVGKVLLRP
jgi:NADPH:quinone reductase-like Zn-dependent oxidoreductase